jgi:hypothetical protein
MIAEEIGGINLHCDRINLIMDLVKNQFMSASTGLLTILRRTGEPAPGLARRSPAMTHPG